MFKSLSANGCDRILLTIAPAYPTPMASPHRRFQFFVSSRIDEFQAERNVIDGYFNSSQFEGHFRAWVYEHAGSEPGTGDDQFLPEISRSQAILFLVGDEISQAVMREFEEARRLKIRCVGLLKRGANRTSEAEGFVTELQRLCRTMPFDDTADCLEQAKLAIRLTEQEILQRAFENSPVPLGATPDIGAKYKMLRDKVVNLCNLGEAVTALEEIERLAASATGNADKADLLHLRGFVKRRQHLFDEALQDVDRALLLSYHPRYEFAKVDILYCAGRDVEASEAFKVMSDAARALVRARIWKVRIALDAGRLEEAFDDLKLLRRLRGEEPFDFWACWAGLALETGHHVAAIKGHKRAMLALPSAAPLAKLGLLDALFSAAQQTGMMEYLEEFRSGAEALRLEDFRNLLVNVGLSEHLEIRILYQKCRLSEANRRPDDTLVLIRQHLERFPDDAYAKNFLRVCEARYELKTLTPQESAELSQTDPFAMLEFNTVLTKIGTALDQQGIEEAEALVKQFVEAQPASANAILLQSFYEASRQNILDARALAWRLIREEHHPFHSRLTAALHLLEMSMQRKKFEEIKTDFDALSDLGLQTLSLVAIYARAQKRSSRTNAAEVLAARAIITSVETRSVVYKNEVFFGHAVHFSIVETLPLDILWAYSKLDRREEGVVVARDIISGMARPLRVRLEDILANELQDH